MSRDLETEIVAAFSSETERLTAPAGLADTVRRRIGRRRRTVRLVTAVLGLAGAGAVAGIVVSRPPLPSERIALVPSPPLSIQVPSGADDMALGAGSLYVAAGDRPGATLSAYDRGTGALIRRIPVPARPASVAVAADGSVWLTFYPTAAGGTSGVWRLTPTLAVTDRLVPRRGGRPVAPFDVLPVGTNSALLATDHGVARVHVRVAAGRSTTSVQWLRVAAPGLYPVELARLGSGRVVVRFSADGGGSELVLLNGTARVGAGVGAVVAASPEGLWLVNHSDYDLTRLDDQPSALLQPMEPGPVADRPDVRHRTESVWAGRRTVFLQPVDHPDRLLCFAYRNPDSEPTANLAPAAGAGTVAGVVTDGTTAYVQRAEPQTGSSTIRGYQVPAACRS